MQDVLEVYQRPYDERRPMVAMDEVPKQLVAELRLPIAARPGQPRRVDYEYRRNGTANIFMLFEPLAARRRVKVTERRTKVDWAYLIRDLVDVHYPEAEIVVLVMDNLNTHAKASLYEAFEPKDAKRIADKLEIHYTPKHGSWLNVAESELSVMAGNVWAGESQTSRPWHTKLRHGSKDETKKPSRSTGSSLSKMHASD